MSDYPRLVKLTFLDKKETELIGQTVPWKESVRWITAEDIRIVGWSDQFQQTTITFGGQTFIVKEDMDQVASLVNGISDSDYDCEHMMLEFEDEVPQKGKKTETIKYFGEDVDVVVDKSKS